MSTQDRPLIVRMHRDLLLAIRYRAAAKAATAMAIEVVNAELAAAPAGGQRVDIARLVADICRNLPPLAGEQALNWLAVTVAERVHDHFFWEVATGDVISSLECLFDGRDAFAAAVVRSFGTGVGQPASRLEMPDGT